jgi:hypothetical protein
MLFRPAPKYRAWWDTETAKAFGAKGLATYLIGKRIAFVGAPEPDNDRDHLKW